MNRVAAMGSLIMNQELSHNFTLAESVSHPLITIAPKFPIQEKVGLARDQFSFMDNEDAITNPTIARHQPITRMFSINGLFSSSMNRSGSSERN